MSARRSALSVLRDVTRRDLVVAAVTVALDALVLFSPQPTFDPLGWDPGQGPAVAVDVAWALLTLPWLLVRRTRPGTALAGVVAMSVVGSLLLTCRPTITVLVAVAALVATRGVRGSLPVLALAVPACAAWVLNEVRHGENGSSVAVWAMVALTYAAIATGAVLFGHWQGRGREREDALVADGVRALEDERARVARELHDVVAHSVTVMTLQSAGARAVIGRDAARAAEALQAVEATGAQAVEELRTMLTHLRRPDAEVGPGADGPGLDRLPELVETARASGREVLVVHDGVARPAAPGVGQAVYRLVQEGITNALKHAGPGPVEIGIRWAAEHLDVVISSPAPVPGQPAPVGSTGLGLRGLRERLELVGGSLDAGPDADGRWLVRGRVPLS